MPLLSQLDRRSARPFPTPDTAVARVEALALHKGRSTLIQERGFVFEWRPDHPIDDAIYYDLDYYELPITRALDVFEPTDGEDSIDPTELDDLAAASDCSIRPILPRTSKERLPVNTSEPD